MDTLVVEAALMPLLPYILDYFHNLHDHVHYNISGTQTLISRCWLGRGNLNAHTFGNPCSQITVYLIPELERTLLNRTFDTFAQMSSDVAGQMFPVCLRENVPVEITRLYKVVILGMRDIRTAHDLTACKPARISKAFRIGLGATIAIGCVDRLIAIVTIAHRSVLVVAMHLDVRLVNWQLQVVRANTIPVRIRIAEQATQ